MAIMGGLFNSGQGNGWTASGTNILQPSTVDQANTAYDQTQQGLAQQQAFLQALQAQNGVGNQSSVFNQLQGVANGTGPNPAQAALQQATGNNISQQAALMAGQRGAGANPALIARQAAMQGANTQQNAIGQAANLQANQSLGALNQLGGIAGQQVNNQANAVNSYNQAAQGQQANILNGIAGQNNANVSMQSNINNANAGIANTNAQAQNKLIGGALSGAGSALGALFAEGGEVKAPLDGPQSRAARHLKGIMMSDGGNVPVVLSPGEKVLSREEAMRVADGKENYSVGKEVPGKAKVKGDSLKNDVVPAKLSAGDIVIPRSIMQSDDPERDAAAFVRAHMSRSQKLGKR